VNQLRLMPCYEFDEWMEQPPAGVQEVTPGSKSKEQRMNYWGYGNAYYFAPKASYASEPQRAPEEVKDLVRASHQAGIEIILEFCFDDRMDVSAVIRCLTYWAEEYHIDGFAVIARDSIVTELARLPLFNGRKLIATWYPGDALAHRKNHSVRMLAESNDGFKNDCRRLLKGEEDCLNAFSWRIRQNPKDHAAIHYLTNHDGFTMADLVSYDCKHNEANGEQGHDGTDYNYSWNCGFEGPTTKKSIRKLRLQQMKNAFVMMLLAQGTPMLLAGDEFANSQQGNNNPYCHDSELTWTDWSRKRSYRELTAFVKQLTAFRRDHGILHMKQELYCMDMHASGYPDLSFHGSNAWYGAFEPMNRYLGCMYDSSYAGEEGFLYIAYNFHWEAHDFALPLLPKQMSWRKVMDTSKKESFIAFDEQEIYEQEKSFEVSPRTVVILEAGKRQGGSAEESLPSADAGKDQRAL
jgi:glycogen operon protein